MVGEIVDDVRGAAFLFDVESVANVAFTRCQLKMCT